MADVDLGAIGFVCTATLRRMRRLNRHGLVMRLGHRKNSTTGLAGRGHGTQDAYAQASHIKRSMPTPKSSVPLCPRAHAGKIATRYGGRTPETSGRCAFAVFESLLSMLRSRLNVDRSLPLAAPTWTRQKNPAHFDHPAYAQVTPGRNQTARRRPL